MTTRSRGNHMARKRGGDCTYGRNESCHGGELQKQRNSRYIDENVGQIECCKLRWFAEGYGLKCESVCPDGRGPLDGGNSFDIS